jgi:hypothetical protein
LTQIKAAFMPLRQALRSSMEHGHMVEYPLVLAGIVAAFVVFGIALAYVDRIAAHRPDPNSLPAE